MNRNNTASAREVIFTLKKHGTREKARASAWFFKTKPGEYGHGDVFLGVTVPEQRIIARQYKDLPLSEIETLLESDFHEARLTALIILVGQFARANEKERARIARFYLENKSRVNNWDLVDTSAHKILGEYLVGKDRDMLYTLARSKNMWDRRIAIIASAAFIARHDFKDTLTLAKIFLDDKEDLMHKATGWMLREVGKRNRAVLEKFIVTHIRNMPRTTLRYAIERFSPEERALYLTLK